MSWTIIAENIQGQFQVRKTVLMKSTVHMWISMVQWQGHEKATVAGKFHETSEIGELFVPP